MNIEIIRQVSELEQWTWAFNLYADFTMLSLSYQYFIIEKRTNRQHKFEVTDHWTRGYGRDNSIKRPEVPPNVEAELRTKIKELVDKAEIK